MQEKKLILLWKGLNGIYFLIGIYFTCAVSRRIWEEGIFGNDIHIYFFYRFGSKLLFLLLIAFLSLAVGAALNFFSKNLGLWLSRCSFFVAVIYLINAYLIDNTGYIWNSWIDFFVFSILIFIVYLPIIIKWVLFKRYLSKSRDN